MTKGRHIIFDINVKGAANAVAGTDDMIVSVIEALQSQFPKLHIVGTRHDLTEDKKPFLMIPTSTKKAGK